MLTFSQAALLGLLQGFTELFPISSLGHSVLLPLLLNWHLDQSSDQFLTFLVATHLATALVLFFFFWRDWLDIFKGLWRSIVEGHIASDNVQGKIGWLLVVATVPAGVCGFLFQSTFADAFSAGALVSVALILNGIILFTTERMRARMAQTVTGEGAVATLSWEQAAYVGVAQCLALIPGFSRSGITMTGGLWSGLSHEDAARFSFLLATPIIGAAAVLKVPHLLGSSQLGVALVGAACAAAAAWASVVFLMKYFETKTLKPFAIYCILAGIAALALLH